MIKIGAVIMIPVPSCLDDDAGYVVINDVIMMS